MVLCCHSNVSVKAYMRKAIQTEWSVANNEHGHVRNAVLLLVHALSVC
jgi:hypothetical protein